MINNWDFILKERQKRSLEQESGMRSAALLKSDFGGRGQDGVEGPATLNGSVVALQDQATAQGQQSRRGLDIFKGRSQRSRNSDTKLE